MGISLVLASFANISFNSHVLLTVISTLHELRKLSLGIKLSKRTPIYDIIFFSDRVIYWWNKLDHDVVCVTSVNAFKNRMQRIWESDQFVFGP